MCHVLLTVQPVDLMLPPGLGLCCLQETAAALMARLATFKMETEDDFDPTRFLDRSLIRLCQRWVVGGLQLTGGTCRCCSALAVVLQWCGYVTATWRLCDKSVALMQQWPAVIQHDCCSCAAKGALLTVH